MDELVKRLSDGMHKVVLERSRSAQELKEDIDRGYVLLKFPETRGGTEIGIRLDKARSVISEANFAEGKGIVQLVGTLVLNYNEVEAAAQIDLGTLSGTGHLTLIAEEATWRARQATKQAS
jgi:hypothetical protein